MAYKDLEKQRAFQREWKRKCNLRDRLEAIKILGGACIECGETDFRVLQFDHIEPELRSGIKSSGSRNARLIVLGELTRETIQLLCANCHSIKTYEIDRKKFKNFY